MSSTRGDCENSTYRGWLASKEGLLNTLRNNLPMWNVRIVKLCTSVDGCVHI